MSTTIPDFWQTAWDAAQPRLDALRQSPTRTPIFRPLRVGQLDSEQLDSELLVILKEPLRKGLDLIKSAWGVDHEPELALLLRAFLYYFSVWNTGATYGAKLQNLKYQVSPRAWSNAGSKAPSGLPRRLLLSHAGLTILLPYFHTRLRSHALSNAWPDAPSSDKRRKAWEALSQVESLHGALSLASFVVFLWNGRYRTLADRLFGLRLEPVKRLVNRSVNYDFMNRQMVWHAFTEFLLFILPLIDMRALKRRLLQASASLQPMSYLPIPSYFRHMLGLSKDKASNLEREHRGPYWSLSTSECAICAEEAATTVAHMIAPDASERSQELAASEKWMPEAAPTHPLNTPYITSCGHVYCYVCVADRVLRAADDGGGLWECLRCTAPVLGIHRADSDSHGFGDDLRTRTAASGSFDMDGSSLLDFDSDAISSTSPLSDSD
ncbi:peroxisomal biogenesis factor 2 [Rhizoctonia solani AG-3 Rhs1AP]|uniref:RING-type E3 ubiquitin transferase (cysteine targeting) n=1 Tax=Rhizoctonia solani AG-3 Rhs1AP TaxID=1086054 RepID=X8JUM6_9AGAM|nr:peroxisomal biogenesis factor 2 [Rhizoctonia solani AG-3 Rhs1AP]